MESVVVSIISHVSPQRPKGFKIRSGSCVWGFIGKQSVPCNDKPLDITQEVAGSHVCIMTLFISCIANWNGPCGASLGSFERRSPFTKLDPSYFSILITDLTVQISEKGRKCCVCIRSCLFCMCNHVLTVICNNEGTVCRLLSPLQIVFPFWCNTWVRSGHSHHRVIERSVVISNGRITRTFYHTTV